MTAFRCWADNQVLGMYSPGSSCAGLDQNAEWTCVDLVSDGSPCVCVSFCHCFHFTVMSLTPEIEDIHRQACLQVRGVTWRGITVVCGNSCRVVFISQFLSCKKVLVVNRSKSFHGALRESATGIRIRTPIQLSDIVLVT